LIIINWFCFLLKGLILLIISLIVLCVCLIGMVKVLSSLFKGSIAQFIQKIVNYDLPGVFKYVI
jgi:sodium-dependent phosphate cotransporter